MAALTFCVTPVSDSPQSWHLLIFPIKLCPIVIIFVWQLISGYILNVLLRCKPLGPADVLWSTVLECAVTLLGSDRLHPASLQYCCVPLGPACMGSSAASVILQLSILGRGASHSPSYPQPDSESSSHRDRALLSGDSLPHSYPKPPCSDFSSLEILVPPRVLASCTL